VRIARRPDENKDICVELADYEPEDEVESYSTFITLQQMHAETDIFGVPKVLQTGDFFEHRFATSINVIYENVG
jgi:hypothetical protein